MPPLIFVEELRGNPLGRSRIRSRSPFTARLTRETTSGAQKGGLTTKLGRVIDALAERAALLGQTAATETADEPTGDRKALYRAYFQRRSSTKLGGFSSVAQRKAYWATNQFRNRRKAGQSARAGWKFIYVRKKLGAAFSLVNNVDSTRFIYGGFSPQTKRQQPFHRAVGVRSANIIRDRSFDAALEFLRQNAPAALGDLGLLSVVEAVD